MRPQFTEQSERKLSGRIYPENLPNLPGDEGEPLSKKSPSKR